MDAKKILSFILAGTLALALVACGSSESDEKATETVSNSESEEEVLEEAEEEVSEEKKETEEEAEEEEDIENVEEELTEDLEAEEQAEESEGNEDAENNENNENNEDEESETESGALANKASEVGADIDSLGEYIDGAYEHEFEDEDSIADLIAYGARLALGQFDECEYSTSFGKEYGVVRYRYVDDYMDTVEVANAAYQDNENAIEVWGAVREDLLDVASICDTALLDSTEDYHTVAVLVNNRNTDKALMIAYNGEIVYDCVSK